MCSNLLPSGRDAAFQWVRLEEFYALPNDSGADPPRAVLARKPHPPTHLEWLIIRGLIFGRDQSALQINALLNCPSLPGRLSAGEVHRQHLCLQEVTGAS